MAERLFVGNIPHQSDERDIKSHFESWPKITAVTKVQIIRDRETGHSRGFGFVEVECDDLGSAIRHFDTMKLQGRALTVNRATPKIPRPKSNLMATTDRRPRNERYDD